MKNLLKVVLLLLAHTIATQLNAQTLSPIKVGALVNGVPTLTQTDAELTALFDFVLNEATLSNAAVKTRTDAQGQFYYLGATATRPNQSSPNPIVIVLTQRGDELIFTSSGDGAGCVMECVPRFSCTSCEQTLVERCTSQRCSCTSSSGGCGTRIIFPE